MKKFLSGLGLIAIAASLATASAGELISGTTTAQCYNCGKKAVDLGQWDNCALASVAQGGANSSCAVGRYSDGWALSVVDPKADANGPGAQTCAATCFSVDKPAGRMTGNDISHKIWPDVKPPVPPTPTAELGLTYGTSEGVWTPGPKGNGQYYGYYTSDSGRIIGSLNGTTFTGIWVERHSSQRCNSERDGSFYWGRLQFNFSNDFSTFSGKWGYCDTAPNAGGWSGTRK